MNEGGVSLRERGPAAAVGSGGAGAAGGVLVAQRERQPVVNDLLNNRYTKFPPRMFDRPPRPQKSKTGRWWAAGSRVATAPSVDFRSGKPSRRFVLHSTHRIPPTSIPGSFSSTHRFALLPEQTSERPRPLGRIPISSSNPVRSPQGPRSHQQGPRPAKQSHPRTRLQQSCSWIASRWSLPT